MKWLEQLMAPENLLALLGVVVTVGGLSYERLIPGRKRIGYRVQMDTLIDDTRQDGPAHQRLRMLEDTPDLAGASLVLLRIENDGFRSIDADDYITAPSTEHRGLTATFPQRVVQDVAVTEPSHPDLLRHLRQRGTPERPGLIYEGHQISLPRVPLNKGDHFKLLVLLTGAGTDKPPHVGGRIKEGRVRNNEKFRRPSNRVLGLIGSLLALLILQSFGTPLLRDDPLPRGCATGTLTIVGSTAFAPVAEDLRGAYQSDCRGAVVTVAAQGSGQGAGTLRAAGEAAKGGFPAYLSFSDGPQGNGDQRLKEHLVAVSVFTLVLNKDVRMTNLSLTDLRRVYAGEITNWKQLPGGPDLPVRLVSRDANSGTRKVFEKRLLNRNELSRTSDDCRSPQFRHDKVVRCELGGTPEVVRTVARTPGAIGYTELRHAEVRAAHGDVDLLDLDGVRASVDAVKERTYPFWEPEYAYTYTAPPDNSLTSKFLDYMAGDTGRNLIEKHGHLPCSVPENQNACRRADRGR
ncbi:substrate-binding domain-containing protein [Streptomyces sp. S465]|uniref:substrate-binding domain-containing protein n=1 Tax=Streptomyces sp. S465 TaxID=2979468 RepID=UPI0022A89309|nr:substrate-binding domain-containing protein [Streptomyces sp. S465]WAP58428.1 substrate-binding domain-containing protein [Streptomyces sp. S465]